MKKLKILFAVVIVTLQGFIACKSDDISPPHPQSISQQDQNLVKDNNLKRVEKPANNVTITYLRNVENTAQFLAGLKGRINFITKSSQAKAQWASPRSANGMTANGIFTFPNGHSLTMSFDANSDISSLKINGNNDISYHYEIQNGYLEIIKWGIIAIPQIGDLGSNYEYYYAPITRWETFLDSSWSSVRYFNTEANLDVEDFGTFKIFYAPSEFMADPFPIVH